MYDLSRFCEAVTNLCHQARVFDGKKANQQDLADAIGVQRTVLNKRLHGKGGHKLSHENVRAIVRTVAGWEVIGSHAEARALLDLVECPHFTASEWQVAPLANLIPDPQPEPAGPPTANLTLAPLAYQPGLPPRVRGRAGELGRLHRLLRENRCVAITGLHGVGKSILTTIYYRQFTQEGSRAYWHVLGEQTTMHDLVAGFFAAISQSRDLGRLTAEQQASVLLAWLRQQPERYLLVLDNCEILLDKTNRFKREGFDLLLSGLIEHSGNSEVVLTSRYLPITSEGREPYELTLGGLSDEDGSLLLRDQRITELLDEQAGDLSEVLPAISARAGGHPLALIYLVQLLRKGYTLPRLLKDDQLWRGEIGQNLLGSVYANLAPREKQLLQYLSVFGQEAVSGAEVAGMLAQLSPPPARWQAANVEQHALILRRRTLVNVDQNSYRLLPIVRHFAYDHLSQPARYHAAAARYLLTIMSDPRHNPPHNLAAVRPLLRAFEQFYAAAEYGEAYHLLAGLPLGYLNDGSPLTLVELLHRWGQYQLLLRLCQQMVAVAHELEPEQQAVALSNNGFAHYLLGQVEAAAECQQQALTLTISDQHRAMCLTRLGQADNWLGQPHTALEHHRQAFDLAFAGGYRRVQAISLGNQGIVYADLAQYETAVEQLSQALALARELGDQRAVSSYLANLGTISQKRSDYQAALGYYAEALKVVDATNYVEGKSGLLANIGLVQMALGDYQEAIAGFERVIALDEQNFNLRVQSSNLNNLGLAYERLGNYREAACYYRQALEAARQTGSQRSACLAQANLGSAYRGLGDLNQALAYNEQAWSLAEELRYPVGMVSAANNLALVCGELGNYQQAFDWGAQALACASETHNEDGRAKALGYLGRTCTFVGQHQRAISYLRDALTIVQQTGNRRSEGSWWHYLGDLFVRLAAIREAIACYIKAQTLREVTGDPAAQATSDQIIDLYQQTPAEAWPDLYAAARELSAKPGWLPVMVGD